MKLFKKLLSAAFSRLRTILFWTHLVVGVTATIFIAALAISGICIAYEAQITAYAERNMRAVVPPPAATSRLSPETIINAFETDHHVNTLSGLVMDSSPKASAMIYVNTDVYFVNPYTGATVGEGKQSLRAFFQWMLEFHRALALPNLNHSVGKAITGAASLAAFSLFLTGVFIWLPKRFSWKGIKAVTTFNWKLKGRSRDWNWHNVTGFWLAPLILVLTLTGVIMSYEWANDILFRVAGSPVRSHGERRPENGNGHVGKLGENKKGSEGGDHVGNDDHVGKLGENKSGGKSGENGVGAGLPDVEGLNDLWLQAERQEPDWRSISVQFGRGNLIQFMIARSGSVTREDRLMLDRETGEVVRWEPFAEQSRGRQWREWVRLIHTGEWGSLLGESISVITALGLLLLAWTGACLSWRRFFRKSSRTP